MSYRTGDITAPTALTRTLRRTAIAGAGLAMIVGMAAPAHAASPGTASTTTTAAAATSTIAVKAAVKAAVKPAVKPAVHAPSIKQLITRGTQHRQVFLGRETAAQRANAEAIIKTGQALKLPPRAWVIALATSMQETHLHNYGNLGHLNDHDSLGLFQQRPSSGWGKPAQIVKPNYAATKFYKALTHVHNWNKLPLTVAAQKVQVSAFGDRYAQWETQAARQVLDHFTRTAH